MGKDNGYRAETKVPKWHINKTGKCDVSDRGKKCHVHKIERPISY